MKKRYNSFDEYMDDLTPREKTINFIVVLVISFIVTVIVITSSL